MKHVFTTVLATTALVATVNTAQAQNLSYIGVIGQLAGGTNDPDNDNAFALASGFEAGFVYDINSVSRIVAEGRYLNWNSDDDDGEENFFDSEPGKEVSVAIHYLRDAGTNLTYGGFLMLGSSVADEDDPVDETYEHYAIGIEGTYKINDMFTTYGQLGVANTIDDDSVDDSSGYMDGEFVRLGAVYTRFENTNLFLDLQIGRSDEYEDDNEPGEFRRIALGGETSFEAGSDWAVTYEISQAKYDALNDPDVVNVTTVGLGMRYYFGGSQSRDFMEAGAIGTPDIISRANLYTDTQD